MIATADFVDRVLKELFEHESEYVEEDGYSRHYQRAGTRKEETYGSMAAG